MTKWNRSIPRKSGADGINGVARRVGVSVEVIARADARMGTARKIQETWSRRASIGTPSPISERLANLGESLQAWPRAGNP